MDSRYTPLYNSKTDAGSSAGTNSSPRDSSSTAPEDSSCDSSVTASEALSCDSSVTASEALSCDSSSTCDKSTEAPSVQVSTLDGSADSEDDDTDGFSGLLTYMENKLKIADSPASKTQPKQILETLDIDGVVKYIQSGKCKNIITMAGAGISTSAGIPDFRSPESGLYNNLQKYELPYPEAIFELDFFCKDPQPFFTLAKELYPGSFNPTPCHYFIKMLEQKGLLLRHFTQNIDTLEHIAGISTERLVEAHGSFRTAHCLHCRQEYSQQWIKDEIFADRVPSCESCSGVVKPDIVFFGEGLPSLFFQRLSSDFPKCDLLIILGTSLSVQPFASLVDNVPKDCPRLLINREAVGTVSMASLMQQLMSPRNREGLQLNSPHNWRDVALLGDCDDGCKKLIALLGWQDEFEKMNEEMKKKQNEEEVSTPLNEAAASSKN